MARQPSLPQAGGHLIVRALDRLAGTTTMAIETINDLHETRHPHKSLTEPDIGSAIQASASATLRTSCRNETSTGAGSKRQCADGDAVANRTSEELVQ